MRKYNLPKNFKNLYKQKCNNSPNNLKKNKTALLIILTKKKSVKNNKYL